MADSPTDPGTVFISYSHQDAAYLVRLQQHLAPYVRSGAIPLWDDTQIKPGDDWKRGIEQALDAARTALLLVSVSFLASEFVAKEELPKLLAAAEARGTRILPVILTPCLFRRTTLNRFQAINDPAQPLSGLTQHEQDLVWERVVEIVLDTLDAPANVPQNSSSEPATPRTARESMPLMRANPEGPQHWPIAHMDEHDLQNCEQVLAHLTEREREVLRAFAEGLTPRLVAMRLLISLATVDTHKTRILSECRAAWNHPPDVYLTYHFLREKFGRYFG